MAERHFFTVSAIALSALVATPATAQSEPASAPVAGTSDAATETAPATPGAAGAQVYDTAYFAQYAPRSALDMVSQIPGFLIKDGNQNNQGPQRGLGQASANVLINGERLASKSESVRDQLAQIPAASVVRIEVVDGASTGVPGLSGQVANIIAKASGKMTGQFEWNPGFRAHYAKPNLLGGKISVKGATGPVEYTASLTNEPDRGAFGGPYEVYDGEGTLIERRRGSLSAYGEFPKLAVGLTLDGPGTSVGHLNASYQRAYFNLDDLEFRDLVTGIDFDRDVRLSDRGFNYEISGDYEFKLGPGRLKLIGLERYNRSHFVQTALYEFADDSPDLGNRYMQTVGQGEHIARGEYSWKIGKADMQLAAEAAFNRLDKEASLFELADGEFVEIPFPGGDGGVTEDRYETILSVGLPLAANLRLQTSAGWEFSKIAQTGLANATRSFRRPKGSATLAWQPGSGFDITLKVERRVGQLQFEDFLARVFLENGNENGVNAELVPEQSWDTDLTIKKTLGKWGSTQLRLFDRKTEDFVDIIPLPDGGEGRGNIDKLHRYGLEWTSTFQLEPLGLKGAKVDVNFIAQHSALTDPLTGETRQLSGLTTRLIEMNYRHDLPGSDWAYGADLFSRTSQPYYRLSEVGIENEGPTWLGVFIENKDVMGLTMTARAGNLLGATHNLTRTVYDGLRDRSEVDFVEVHRRRIGPIFSFTVKGSF